MKSDQYCSRLISRYVDFCKSHTIVESLPLADPNSSSYSLKLLLIVHIINSYSWLQQAKGVANVIV